MKALLLGLLLTTTTFASSEYIVDCKARAVFNTSIFEEGLSVFEYPNFDIEKTAKGYIVDVGAMMDIDSSKGDTVEVIGELTDFKMVFAFHRGSKVEKNTTQFKFFFNEMYEYNEEGDELVSHEGVLLAKDAHETNGQWEPLASFTCKQANL